MRWSGQDGHTHQGRQGPTGIGLFLFLRTRPWVTFSRPGFHWVGLGGRLLPVLGHV